MKGVMYLAVQAADSNNLLLILGMKTMLNNSGSSYFKGISNLTSFTNSFILASTSS